MCFRVTLTGLCLATGLLAGLATPACADAQDWPEARTGRISEQPYSLRADAMHFADDVARRRNLDRNWTRSVLGQALYLPSVAQLMLPQPGGTKNWRVYRRRFVEPMRIRAGVRFWLRNRATLRRAEAEFGVPPEIIVGIVGVETIYGQQMGYQRVIDALATLAFDFPSAHPRAATRQAFFRDELEQFLALCQRTGMDPESLGSYAGAMGMPQFMPSSWAHYAIDYDGDNQIDLWNSEADVIGSVANYFKEHGWQPGLPARYDVRLSPRANMGVLLAPDIEPTFSPARFAALGAQLDADGLAHPGLLALVELQNGNPALHGDPPTWVAGTANFRAITRYNQSAYYAMAVLDLGAAVASAVYRATAP